MQDVTAIDRRIESTDRAAECTFAGPGPARALARSLDWAATPLGPVETWAQSLRTAVDVCLASRFATALLWGPELVLIHNDAHIAALGTRYPGAMGRPAPAVLSDTWSVIGPIVASALAAADGSTGSDEVPGLVDLTVTMDRGGVPRPAYLTASFAPVRDESGRPMGVMVEAVDMTPRVVAEGAHARDAARQSYFVQLADALRALRDPVAVQSVAARLLGEHLGANQVHYAENVDDTVVVHQGYGNGLPPMIGTFRALDFGERLVANYRAGRTAVSNDIAIDPTISAAERAVITDAGFCAYVAVPLVKGGVWSATLAVHSITPRAWTSDEIALVEGTAERTWAAVERARAESALRESERRQNFLLRFSDTLRPLTDDMHIFQTASRLLGEFLGADRCFFGELFPRQNLAIMHSDYARGMLRTLAGRFPMSDFQETVDALQSGRPYVLPDVARSELLSDRTRATYLALGYASYFSVPLFRQGRLVLDLSAVASAPRYWTADEIQLAQEIADRTWTMVERARAQAALRRSERHLRLAMQSAGIYLWELDVATGMVTFSDNVNDITGLPTDAYGSNALARLNRLLAPGDRERMSEAYLRVMRGESELHEVVRATDPMTGEQIWLEAHGVPVRGPDGTPLTVVGVGMNITERRRAEDALRQSEARYRALFDSIDEGVSRLEILYDADGKPADYRWLEANHAYEKQTGLRDVVGRRVQEIVPGYQTETVAIYAEVAHTGVPTRFERYSAELDRWFSVYAAPAAGGPPNQVVIVVRDFTARVRGELMLRESEARFRAITDVVPDLLWEGEPDGSTPWFNARWLEYTGQSVAEAQGRGWARVIHPDDRARSMTNYAHAIERGEPLVQEQRIRRHDGVYRWFLVRAEPVRDESGRVVHWFGAATDINAQRMALEEVERLVADRTAERDALRRHLADAEEAERRRLARELHDQLGQHLAALALGLADARQTLDAGGSADARLAQLEELARFMTRDARFLALELRPPELDDVGLESALQTYVERWSGRYDVSADLAATDEEAIARLPDGVSTAIYRITQEALTNVAKHASASHVSVLLEQTDGEVRLVVEDDGRGFEPEPTMRRARHEHRLGVAGMRERAMMVGGTFELESRPGAGSTVYVRIPLPAP